MRLQLLALTLLSIVICTFAYNKASWVANLEQKIAEEERGEHTCVALHVFAASPSNVVLNTQNELMHQRSHVNISNGNIYWEARLFPCQHELATAKTFATTTARIESNHDNLFHAEDTYIAVFSAIVLLCNAPDQACFKPAGYVNASHYFVEDSTNERDGQWCNSHNLRGGGSATQVTMTKMQIETRAIGTGSIGWATLKATDGENIVFEKFSLNSDMLSPAKKAWAKKYQLIDTLMLSMQQHCFPHTDPNDESLLLDVYMDTQGSIRNINSDDLDDTWEETVHNQWKSNLLDFYTTYVLTDIKPHVYGSLFDSESRPAIYSAHNYNECWKRSSFDKFLPKRHNAATLQTPALYFPRASYNASHQSRIDADAVIQRTTSDVTNHFLSSMVFAAAIDLSNCGLINEPFCGASNMDNVYYQPMQRLATSAKNLLPGEKQEIFVQVKCYEDQSQRNAEMFHFLAHKQSEVCSAKMPSSLDVRFQAYTHVQCHTGYCMGTNCYTHNEYYADVFVADAANSRVDACDDCVCATARHDASGVPLHCSDTDDNLCRSDYAFVNTNSQETCDAIVHTQSRSWWYVARRITDKDECKNTGFDFENTSATKHCAMNRPQNDARSMAAFPERSGDETKFVLTTTPTVHMLDVMDDQHTEICAVGCPQEGFSVPCQNDAEEGCLQEYNPGGFLTADNKCQYCRLGMEAPCQQTTITDCKSAADVEPECADLDECNRFEIILEGQNICDTLGMELHKCVNWGNETPPEYFGTFSQKTGNRYAGDPYVRFLCVAEDSISGTLRSAAAFVAPNIKHSCTSLEDSAANNAKPCALRPIETIESLLDARVMKANSVVPCKTNFRFDGSGCVACPEGATSTPSHDMPYPEACLGAEQPHEGNKRADKNDTSNAVLGYVVAALFTVVIIIAVVAACVQHRKIKHATENTPTPSKNSTMNPAYAPPQQNAIAML